MSKVGHAIDDINHLIFLYYPNPKEIKYSNKDRHVNNLENIDRKNEGLECNEEISPQCFHKRCQEQKLDLHYYKLTRPTTEYMIKKIVHVKFLLVLSVPIVRSRGTNTVTCVNKQSRSRWSTRVRQGFPSPRWTEEIKVQRQEAAVAGRCSTATRSEPFGCSLPRVKVIVESSDAI